MPLPDVDLTSARSTADRHPIATDPTPSPPLLPFPGRARRYDVVIAVSYYAPYVSGLTEVARLEAEGLAARGFRVAVVTNQHDPSLPVDDVLAGVEVHRCRVRWRHGRGVLAPRFSTSVARYARQAHTLHLHAPMLEAGIVTRLVRGAVPVVTTHHIDLWLPPSRTTGLQVRAVNASVRRALRDSTSVVVNSDDQAEGSRFADEITRGVSEAIPAPCLDRRGGTARYRDGHGPHLGFLGRIVADKGLGYLVRAFGAIPDPSARLLIGGESVAVAGGGVLGDLQSAIDADPRIRVLGMLRGSELDDFYASIDTFVLPSVAESFGIVQAEAIMTGVPSVTTDLPGGRFPVVATGLGMLVPPRDEAALTRALLACPTAFDESTRTAAADRARAMWGVDTFLDRHQDLLIRTRNPAARPIAVGS